jgi:hypothetical protein
VHVIIRLAQYIPDVIERTIPRPDTNRKSCLSFTGLPAPQHTPEHSGIGTCAPIDVTPGSHSIITFPKIQRVPGIVENHGLQERIRSPVGILEALKEPQVIIRHRSHDVTEDYGVGNLLENVILYEQI